MNLVFDDSRVDSEKYCAGEGFIFALDSGLWRPERSGPSSLVNHVFEGSGTKGAFGRVD